MLIVGVEGASIGDTYGYHVCIYLSQTVLLERDLSLRATGQFRGQSFQADTWSTCVVGVAKGNPSEKIRSTVKDLVDKFINAYLSVNPKPK